jgi:uncharacterized protein YndB with AHSA1/START domain
MAKPATAENRDADRSLVMTRRLAAPREAVFRAWTDPAQFARWIGPRNITSEVTAMDPRPGGAYRMVMRDAASGAVHIGQGVYREVVPPEHLAFTWAWTDQTGKPGHETIVTVTLRSIGEATEMTLRQELFESRDSRDRHDHGWQGSFAKLAEVLASKR